MVLDQPYFMTNDQWYWFNPDSKKYELTESAPQKAKESYKHYYDELQKKRYEEADE